MSITTLDCPDRGGVWLYEKQVYWTNLVIFTPPPLMTVIASPEGGGRSYNEVKNFFPIKRKEALWF